ncbi:MAG: rhodanese-like domain-containing protein [Anaerolineales bacterium]
MNFTNRRGKAIVRFGLLGGAALLFLAAILFFPKLQAGKQAGGPERTPSQEAPHIGLVEAYKTWSGGSAFFLDLRPNSAFARTHIPGAISIPVEELESRYLNIPNNRAIIVYGDYSLEEPSAQAALFLITHGFPNTTSLRGGIESWIQSGYPIEP